MDIKPAAVMRAFIDEFTRALARGVLAEADAIEADYPGVEVDVGVSVDDDGETLVVMKAYRDGSECFIDRIHLTEKPAALGGKIRLMLDATPRREPAHGTPR